MIKIDAVKLHQNNGTEREKELLNGDNCLEIKSEDKPNKITLSTISHFNSININKKQNEIKKKECWKTTQKYLLHSVENIYSQILILILAVYSLFHDDIMLLFISKNYDKMFHHITEAVFFFFLLEFIILIISNNKFTGSFYFYLDLVSLISLLPEVEIIWHAIIYSISGESEQMNEVLGNSHLAKTSRASQAGSKASKYLRLLRLLNFIKVIRIAKLVETTKVIRESRKKINISRTMSDSKLTKRKQVGINEREIIDKMIAMNIKYTVDDCYITDSPLKKKFFNSNKRRGSIDANMYKKFISNLKERDMESEEIGEIEHKIINVKRNSISENQNQNKIKNKINSSIENNKENFNVKRNSFKENESRRNSNDYFISTNKIINETSNIKNILRKTLEEGNKIRRGTSYMKRRKSTIISKNSKLKMLPSAKNSLSNKPGEKIQMKFKRMNTVGNKRIANGLDISEENNSDEINDKNPQWVAEEIKFAENKKKLSIYFSNVDPYIKKVYDDPNYSPSKSPSKNRSPRVSGSISSSNSSEIMDEYEHQILVSRINSLKPRNLPKRDKACIEEEKENEEIYKNRKGIDKNLFQDVTKKSNLKLEKKLTKTITQQVVIIIMIILISLPMIDIDFLFSLIYPDFSSSDLHEYCVDLIFTFVNLSLYNNSFISNLNMTVNNCFYAPDYISNETDEIPSEVQRFIAIIYNESDVFTQFQKNSNFFSNDSMIKSNDYDNFMKISRKDYDYEYVEYNIDDKNNITYIYDTRHFGNVSSITSILKSLWVAILLISGSYVFSIDVNHYVITPLDKIFTKLNVNLQNLEISDKDGANIMNKDNEEQNDVIPKLDSSDIFSYNATNQRKSPSSFVSLSYKKFKKKKNIQKDEEIFKNSLEPYFIDVSLYKLLNMISLLMGKILFFVIPNSDLETDLKLNLYVPAIKFDGVGLFLKISNTENFLLKYNNLAPKILSKIYTIFHCIGVIYLGEPFKKDNLNVIIWKKNKNEYLNQIKKYAVDLVLPVEKLNTFTYKGNHEKVVNIKNEVYSEHFVDFSIICGLKFLHSILKYLRDTMFLLKECGVKINLFLVFGEFYQSFMGNRNLIEENFYGEVLEHYEMISDKLDIEYNDPSLFINNTSYSFINDEFKKKIFPYEIIELERNRILVYRHYFNYNFYLTYFESDRKDLFDNSNIKIRDILRERNFFEKITIKDKESFLNFIYNNNNYLKITSGVNPTMRTFTDLIYSSLETYDYEKCILLIEDMEHLISHEQQNDHIIFNNIIELKKKIINL